MARFLCTRECSLLRVQEINTPHAPTLPEDQPYQLEGTENTQGWDAAILVQDNFSQHCTSIQNLTPHTDIWWRLVALDEGSFATPFPSFYPPHAGCPEAKCLAFWQCLSDSVGEVMKALPRVDPVMAGDSNLWVPGLVHARKQRPADRSCLASLRVMLRTCSWENLTHSPGQCVKQRFRRTQAHVFNPAAQSISQKWSALDSLYHDVLNVVWPADPSIGVHVCVSNGSRHGGMTLVSPHSLPEMPGCANEIIPRPLMRVRRSVLLVATFTVLCAMQSPCIGPFGCIASEICSLFAQARPLPARFDTTTFKWRSQP